MEKLEDIARSVNKPLNAILSHVNAIKPPGVRPPNPWNAYASWYNVEGEYAKPEKWTVQQWNTFVATQYRNELVEAIGEEAAKDPEAVREAMAFYLSWYKEHLTKHLDEIKSNPKKLSRYLDTMLKPMLHYTKQMWEDQGILVWGAAHPTKHNNTSVGQGVMWSGSPLFVRVKERSETQVPRALEDMSTLIHMVQMEGTHASADILDLYREIHCPAKKPPANESERDKHRRWLATIIRHDAARLIKNKHNLAMSNFVAKAWEYQLVLRNYPEETGVPGVEGFTLHNLGAGSLKAMVSARVEYVNKSVAGTLTEKDKCHKHLYVESWSEGDKAAHSNVQENVAIITNVAGADVVLADGTVPEADNSVSVGTAIVAEATTVQPKKAATVPLAKATTVCPKLTTRAMPLYQDDDSEDEAENEVRPPQPRSSAVSTSRPRPVPEVPNISVPPASPLVSLPTQPRQPSVGIHPRRWIGPASRVPIDSLASADTSTLPTVRNLRPVQKSVDTEPTRRPGPASRVPPVLPNHSRPSTNSNVSTIATAITLPQNSSATTAVHSQAFSHLTPVQREMMEWEINEERARRERQQEYAAQMRREAEQYQPPPDGASFWSLEMHSSTEPPTKKRKLGEAIPSGVSRPTKPLPSRVRIPSEPPEAPVASPAGLHTETGGFSNANAEPGPSCPRGTYSAGESSRQRRTPSRTPSLSPSKHPLLDLTQFMKPRPNKRKM
ncbi:hypothetical protein V5O48_010218 [Marasmius crinis-equi]|uniref:Uncharacterized protein n=1 Tax=Marasmius crinis-equi TaxID=585013 RepID=A0ABR3F8Z8_9AGAR